MQRFLAQRIDELQVQRIRDAGESDGGPATSPGGHAARACRSTPSSTTRTTSRGCTRFRALSASPRRLCARDEGQAHAGALSARESACAMRRHHCRRIRFYCRRRNIPASISADDQQRLTKAITDAVNNEVIPAYKKFGEFIATQYAPQGRTTFERHFAARRQGALPQRHSQPHHHQHPDPGSDSRDRPAAKSTASKARCWSSPARKASAMSPSFRESLKTNSKYIPASSEQILDDFPQVHRADAAQAAASCSATSPVRR